MYDRNSSPLYSTLNFALVFSVPENKILLVISIIEIMIKNIYIESFNVIFTVSFKLQYLQTLVKKV